MTDPFALSRRGALGLMGAVAGQSLLPTAAVAATASDATATRWFSTTARAPWQSRALPALGGAPASLFASDATVRLDTPRQTIAGFGGAFSEKGWDALNVLTPADRHAALSALFGTDGCALSLCRTPMGANDISRRWYSYDETPGDFALDHFSIANDDDTLIPFIKAAQAFQPDLRLWASPWSPPTWMKKGGHYAQAPAWPGQPDTGIRPDQYGKEGQDSFLQDDRYFAAYARYFARYVEAYAAKGLVVGHGGLVVHDDSADMAQLARYAMEFCALESCGKCTPCRIGSTRGVEVIDRITKATDPNKRTQQVILLKDLCDTMLNGSLCAMGGMTPYPVLSALDHYPDDFGITLPDRQAA